MTRKLLCVMTALVLVAPLFLVFQSDAKADTDDVQARLNYMLTIYPGGSYFSADGKACTEESGDACANCNVLNIPARGNLPKGSDAVDGNAYTCVGFARYTFYYLNGGVKYNDSRNTVISGINHGEVYLFATLGDHIAYTGHEGIFISGDSSGFWMYESNYTGTGGTNRVGYMTHRHTEDGVTIRHAYGSSISFDTYAIEETTEDDIRASAWFSNPKGLFLSEIGMQCGTDKNNAEEKTIAENVNWTRALLDYHAKKYFGSLASNHTYYIRYYVIAEGRKTYSNWFTASTVKGALSFDTYSIENLYESDVRLSAWLDNPDARLISEIGILYGRTKEYTDSKTIVSDVNWSRSNQSYYLSRFFGNYLESNTQYYARYYAVTNNKTYFSDWFSIKTPAGGISFDTYSVDSISDTSATTSVWLDNVNARALSQIGIEYFTDNDPLTTVLVTENVAWTRAHLQYNLNALIGALKPDTIYRVRFYVIAEGKRYCSEWLKFKTDVSSTPTVMPSPDFILPANLTAIEFEAFSNLAMAAVKCPEGLEEIDARAFAGCLNLRDIYIPESVTGIDGTAFAGCTDLTIWGRAGSAAEAYADNYGLTFKEYLD